VGIAEGQYGIEERDTSDAPSGRVLSKYY